MIDTADFRHDLLGLEGDVYAAIADAMTDAVDAAAKDAFSTNLFQNHTWKLRSSTKASVDKIMFRGKLSNATPYARYVEEGTRPHVIAARRKPLLRFYWTRHGFWFAGKKVNHPGTKPRPFMRHAGEVGGVKLRELGEAYTDRAINRFNAAA